jgi:DNA-binding SARP family transcriptional activator
VSAAADGTTTPAAGDATRHGAHPADIGRLTVLDPAETADLLGTLAEAHTGLPQQPPPSGHTSTPVSLEATAPETATIAQQRPRPAAGDTGAAGSSPASDVDQHDTDTSMGPPSTLSSHDAVGSTPVDDFLTTPAGPATTEPATTVHASDRSTGRPARSSRTDEPAAEEQAAPAATDPEPAKPSTPTPDDGGASRTLDEDDAGRAPVQVTVLGAAGIVDADPQRVLRKKSLEVLVYLAVHDGAASAEAILDDVLPDAPASKAPGRLYTYISDLRTILRHTAGPGSYITHPDHRYILNRDTLDIDLWRMHDALRDAQTADTDHDRRAALRRAVDTYTGHLADGADYEWIEPYREATRRQTLDAYLTLADTLSGNPAEQVTVLDAAIRHNPHTEQLYQQAMRAHAALGHTDAIRTLRRTLTRALDDIDAEPSDDTITLADQLITHAQRPGHRPPPRPAPQPGDGAAA